MQYAVDLPIDKLIPQGSQIFEDIHRIVAENAYKIAELSGKFQTQADIQRLLSEITQSHIDETLHVNLPLYCDFGRHLRIGKNVFINTACMFTDLGELHLKIMFCLPQE